MRSDRNRKNDNIASSAWVNHVNARDAQPNHATPRSATRANAPTAPFPFVNLVTHRVGAASAAFTSNPTRLFLDQYTLSGTSAQSITMPTAVSRSLLLPLIPQSTPIFAENFDGVTAPALPPGWTATNAMGPAPLWVTSNSGNPTPAFDTSPNAAFIDDPGTESDKRLDSPPIPITTSNAQLIFRNNYDLEYDDLNNAAFDGGVLEISIGGGAFTDIITAGGSFVTGGYNKTIDNGNTFLAGRQAWGGASNGFI